MTHKNIIRCLRESQLDTIEVALRKEVEYFLNNGLEVYIIQLPRKDPSEAGYSSMVEAMHKAKKVNFFDLIQFKMSL